MSDDTKRPEREDERCCRCGHQMQAHTLLYDRRDRLVDYGRCCLMGCDCEDWHAEVNTEPPINEERDDGGLRERIEACVVPAIAAEAADWDGIIDRLVALVREEIAVVEAALHESRRNVDAAEKRAEEAEKNARRCSEDYMRERERVRELEAGK